ncbi:unnamed protein product [Rotaria socialis]|uniref:G-protein coupled receptors family 1 profile domain-containing protein n=1 Tax=Rotaria socialis TaxID=392032 RepID=A0A821DPQ8_9BILA|nr:unnamed protein product [Rotaria socialis]CAF3325857.1 unnamed protein product [Rotaria socialis]CAF3424069.1 unnamed protein product [Rotaria socialis]CAF3610429.1 unnamed protein product [Rotaria socialis]CAF3666044.1 unnamed protein product [Rotaria socialis]
MSTPPSDALLIAYLNNVLAQINFYFGMFIFTFGIAGNILNILILSQRPLRTNSCAIIFFGSSTAGIIAIVSGLVSRVLSGVTTDLSATVNWICRLRGFIIFSSRAVTFWLIMFASVDRWLLSSTNALRRQLSSMKNSLRGIGIITIISIIIHSQLFYCYEANLVDTPLQCFTKNIPCRLMNDLTFAIITILIPLIFIILFGLMTISNMRLTRIRVEPTAVAIANVATQKISTRKSSKKIDHRLFRMLFVQSVCLGLFTLPLAIEKLYATLTMDMQKSALQTTIENFIYQVALINTFFAVGMPFYVNILAGGSIYRNGLFSLKNKIVRKLMCTQRLPQNTQ